MLKINFHVGAHRLYPKVFSDMPRAMPEKLAEHNIFVVSSRRFEKLVQPLIWDREELVASQAAANLVIDELTGGHDEGTLALSRGSILCDGNRIFRGGRLYPETSYPLEQIDYLFANRELTFHFAICSIPDFLAGLKGNEARAAVSYLETSSPRLPAWAPAIRDMAESVPNRRIVVWDCDARLEMSPWFRLGLLGPGSQLPDELLDLVLLWSRSRGSEEADLPNPAIPEQIVHLLDASYEADLRAVAAIPNVDVMTLSDDGIELLIL